MALPVPLASDFAVAFATAGVPVPDTDEGAGVPFPDTDEGATEELLVAGDGVAWPVPEGLAFDKSWITRKATSSFF